MNIVFLNTPCVKNEYRVFAFIFIKYNNYNCTIQEEESTYNDSVENLNLKGGLLQIQIHNLRNGSCR